MSFKGYGQRVPIRYALYIAARIDAVAVLPRKMDYDNIYYYRNSVNRVHHDVSAPYERELHYGFSFVCNKTINRTYPEEQKIILTYRLKVVYLYTVRVVGNSTMKQSMLQNPIETLWVIE